MAITALEIIERLRSENAWRFYPSASAYLCADCMVIFGVGKTLAGLDIPQEPIGIIDRAASDAELGSAVISAFGGFQPLAPGVEDIEVHFRPVLRACGVVSFRQLQKHTLYCDISCGPDEIIFLPSHSDKRGFWFASQDEKFTLSLTALADSIGATLKRAFCACTSTYTESAPKMAQQDRST